MHLDPYICGAGGLPYSDTRRQSPVGLGRFCFFTPYKVNE
jgi:hypothetical protein